MFAEAHGGAADAMVQHLGRDRAEVVVVGGDGVWGNIAVASYQAGVDAIEMAGIGAGTWSPAVVGRVRGDVAHWERMGGVNPFSAPSDHHAPRDGTTQVGAKLFFWIGVFATFAGTLFAITNHRRTALQGTSILFCFALANFLLTFFLRMAKARPSDARYAAETGITMEPEEPDPPVDLETLHLPGPSWMPASYGVACGVLVVGLVFAVPVLIAGVVLLVLTTIGWAIESVREYRAAIAGHGEAHPGGAPDRDPVSAHH
jgi:hypothetical protein